MPSLTRRELEAARLLAMGLKYAEIAGYMCIEYSTVKQHICHARQKYGAATGENLIAILISEGIIDRVPRNIVQSENCAEAERALS